jgi:hypothetical protein
MPWARTAYTVLAAIFLLIVVLQFLTAGLGIFRDADDFDIHREGAGGAHLVPLLMLIIALVGKLGRNAAIGAFALLVLVAIQSFLPSDDIRQDAPVLAALHPLLALVLAFVGHSVFQRSRVVSTTTRSETAA